MIKCPVCDTEYSKGQVDVCPTCAWYLTPHSQNGLPVVGGKLEEFEQVAKAWAKQIWKRMELLSYQQSLSQTNPDVLFDKLSKLVSHLDKRVEAIEQHLTANSQENSAYSILASPKGEIPSVAEHTQTPRSEFQSTTKEIQLSFQEAQLVATYNHNFNLLSKKAVQVSETEESMSQHSQSATLETTRRGNYWIINAGELNYLIPRPKLRINSHNYKFLDKLFDCCGYQLGEYNEILLLKSAKVSVISIGQKWELVERGVLYFEPKEKGEVQNNIETTLVLGDTPTSDSEFRQVPISSYKNLQERQVESTLNPKIVCDTNQSSPTPENQFRPAPPELYMSPQEAELVTAYNRNPGSLSKKATEVSETDESINQRRLKKSQPAVLQANRWGDYWIIVEGTFHYVVPRSGIKIKQSNYDTIQALFECYGGKMEEFHQFQLLKAVQVSSISPQKWQLTERGVLLFE